MDTQSMTRRVVVTGIGAIVAGATGKQQLLDLLLSEDSAIGPLTRFASSSLPSPIAGEIKDFSPCDYMDRRVSRRMDRAAQLAVATARLACRDADLKLPREECSRAGVFEGTSLGPLVSTLESHRRYINTGCRYVNPTMLMSSMMGSGSGFIGLELGIHGPTLTISDGSASSTYAIGYGFRNIKAGNLDVAIAGGAEAPLSEEVFATFGCARVLSACNNSPREAMKPFDRDRDGFVLGEGAAFLVLEELSHAQERGGHIYGEIVGFGETTDAFHPTSPDPTGVWAACAMNLALKEGGVHPDKVQYLNAHGTATKANDTAETSAIKQVFGRHASTLSVSSTKPIAGHLLGACGGLEAALTLLSMENAFIPPTLNLSCPDRECDLDYVPKVGRKQHIESAMSNNSSFGGRNASLLFKHLPHP